MSTESHSSDDSTAQKTEGGERPDLSEGEKPSQSVYLPSETLSGRLRGVEGQDADRIYRALEARVDGTEYVRLGQLGDGRLTTSQKGVILRALADADDCPLDVEHWSANPSCYRVARCVETDGGVATACDHSSARVEHSGLHGAEAEFWIACPGCGGYWTLHGHLDDVTADISQEEDPEEVS